MDQTTAIPSYSMTQCEVYTSCSASTVQASVITAAILATVVFAVVMIAVCKFYPS